MDPQGSPPGGGFPARSGAYRDWAPALADRAPTLAGADPERRILVISWLPGSPFSGSPSLGATSRMHRQAGSLIRRLHDSAPGVPAPNLVPDMAERLDRWLHRVPGVVEPRDRQMAVPHWQAAIEGNPDGLVDVREGYVDAVDWPDRTRAQERALREPRGDPRAARWTGATVSRS